MNVTTKELARLLDLSVESVYLLSQSGVISKLGHGRWHFDRCVRDYIRHLREQAAGRTSAAAKSKGFDLCLERARREKEQADKLEMENETSRGNLIPVDTVAREWGNMISAARSHLIGLPTRIAAACRAKPTVAALKKAATLEVNMVLTELGTGKKRPARKARHGKNGNRKD